MCVKCGHKYTTEEHVIEEHRPQIAETILFRHLFGDTAYFQLLEKAINDYLKAENTP